jgi:predicted TIM-barrel fold metal-dependent hydrolase
MTVMIDMHAHWRPVEVADALRARTRLPRIERNADGAEILKSNGYGEEPVATAFDNVNDFIARMERQKVTTSVLSLVGSFCWIEGQPVEVATPLCRSVNEALSDMCGKHEGRLLGLAALPLLDIELAARELDRTLQMPGMVGVQLPANAFLTEKLAQKMRPLLEVANRHCAVILIHNGPQPGEPWPKHNRETDNMRRRNGTLDMQANLSSVMVTLCLTDFLAPYPDASIFVHNLGGNIPYEIERMDHRSMLDTPSEELPSVRFRRAKRVMVDCNSFGARAIEAAVALYGADRILCGTDGTEFGGEWTRKALAEARISEEERQQILTGNANKLFARRAAAMRRVKVAA